MFNVFVTSDSTVSRYVSNCGSGLWQETTTHIFQIYIAYRGVTRRGGEHNVIQSTWFLFIDQNHTDVTVSDPTAHYFVSQWHNEGVQGGTWVPLPRSPTGNTFQGLAFPAKYTSYTELHYIRNNLYTEIKLNVLQSTHKVTISERRGAARRRVMPPLNAGRAPCDARMGNMRRAKLAGPFRMTSEGLRGSRRGLQAPSAPSKGRTQGSLRGRHFCLILSLFYLSLFTWPDFLFKIAGDLAHSLGGRRW